jgi:hypothetical protein
MNQVIFPFFVSADVSGSDILHPDFNRNEELPAEAYL